MHFFKYFILMLVGFFIIESILLLIFTNEFDIIRTALASFIFATIMTVFNYFTNGFIKKWDYTLK